MKLIYLTSFAPTIFAVTEQQKVEKIINGLTLISGSEEGGNAVYEQKTVQEPLNNGIKNCHVDNGKSYNLKNLGKSRSGYNCQRWDDNLFHTPSQAMKDIIEEDAGALGYYQDEYCRNPDDDPNGPWCYLASSSKVWEYCNHKNDENKRVAKCEDDGIHEDRECLPVGDKLGLTYVGEKAVDEKGKECKHWNDIKKSDGFTSEYMKALQKYIPSSAEHNYCRNWDEDISGLWCINKDDEVGYCDVKSCGGEVESGTDGDTDGAGSGGAGSGGTGNGGIRSDELECGKFCKPNDLSCKPQTSQIIGGIKTEEFEVPWQTHLRRNTGWGFCGASIINKDWIISAAHCTNEKPPRQIYVAVGWSMRQSAIDKDTGRRVRGIATDIKAADKALGRDFIPEIKTDRKNHPNYQFPHHDITLIRLARPIEYGTEKVTYSRPICLPSKELLPTSTAEVSDAISSKKCIISGWGATTHNKLPTSYSTEHDGTFLLKAYAEIMTNDECGKRYLAVADKTYEFSNVCGQKPPAIDGWMDTCQGDSGGPLVCQVKNSVDGSPDLNTYEEQTAKEQDGRYVLHGLTSYGVHCGVYPGVYTRLAYYVENGWIQGVIFDPTRDQSLRTPFQIMKADGSVCMSDKEDCK